MNFMLPTRTWDKSAITYVQSAWKEKVIEDAYFTSESTCKQGYEATSYWWEGTQPYCAANLGDFQGKNVYGR